MAQAAFPRLSKVQPLSGKRLRVTFVNDKVKIYDCRPLLDQEAFRDLNDEAFFRCVQVDSNGYAVIWNDHVDLAESELWLHGKAPSLVS